MDVIRSNFLMCHSWTVESNDGNVKEYMDGGQSIYETKLMGKTFLKETFVYVVKLLSFH